MINDGLLNSNTPNIITINKKNIFLLNNKKLCFKKINNNENNSIDFIKLERSPVIIIVVVIILIIDCKIA